MNADNTNNDLSSYRMKLRTMLNNRRWIAANIEELMHKHRSKWIVVSNNTVLAEGDTAEGAIAACGAEIDEVENIVLLVPDLVPRPI